MPMAVFSATKYTVPPSAPKRRNSASSFLDSDLTLLGEMVQIQRYATMKRRRKISIGCNPCCNSTLVLTNVTPQMAMVKTANR